MPSYAGLAPEAQVAHPPTSGRARRPWRWAIDFSKFARALSNHLGLHMIGTLSEDRLSDLGLLEGRPVDQGSRGLGPFADTSTLMATTAGLEPGSSEEESVTPLRSSSPEAIGRLPVIEESLKVSKLEVDQGGYRLTKRVEMNQHLVDEVLRTEEVHIERRPINTAIADDDVPGVRQEGNTLIVPVIEEVLITVKRLVLVEEVRITRIQGTRHQPQTVTLRKEEIDIERLAAESSSTVQSS